MSKLISSPNTFDGWEGDLAVILWGQETAPKPGISPLVSETETLQALLVQYPAQHVIPKHVHPPYLRVIEQTQEVIVVRRGRMRVKFYTPSRAYVGEEIIQAGDILILLAGGHGFEMLEDTELFEVKQGPYLGIAKDKERW